MSRGVGSKNAPKKSRAYVVTEIDFNGSPIHQFTFFSDKLKGKKDVGNMLKPEGLGELIKKSGKYEVVMRTHLETLGDTNGKKASKASFEYVYKNCVTIDYDAFMPGRFYVTYVPDGKDSVGLAVGTGKDLYWVVDDILTMRQNNIANSIGVVS